MKKIIKYKGAFSGEEISFTIDENLNQLKGKVLAPKKLADANKALRNMKSPFPEFLRKSK